MYSNEPSLLVGLLGGLERLEVEAELMADALAEVAEAAAEALLRVMELLRRWPIWLRLLGVLLRRTTRFLGGLGSSRLLRLPALGGELGWRSNELLLERRWRRSSAVARTYDELLDSRWWLWLWLWL